MEGTKRAVVKDKVRSDACKWAAQAGQAARPRPRTKVAALALAGGAAAHQALAALVVVLQVVKLALRWAGGGRSR